MIAQVTFSALTAENKMLAHPASIDSLPTSTNQEDHVSMAAHGARAGPGRVGRGYPFSIATGSWPPIWLRLPHWSARAGSAGR
jgi:hypothetical protein